MVGRKARNTVAANNAKALLKSFKSSVAALGKQLPSGEFSASQRSDLNEKLGQVDAEAAAVKDSLDVYAQELQKANESSELVDSLRSEFQQHLDTLNGYKSKLEASSPASPVASKEPVQQDDVVGIGGSQQTLEFEHPPEAPAETVQTTSPHFALDTEIIDQRSQQIQQLRSSVYDIQDLYVQIGDMVEYQGELLDDIENNMYNVVENSQNANFHMTSLRNRRGGFPRSSWLILAILLFCLLVVIVISTRL